jgi:serine/threonine protein kinase HipA of HipAB toxin-antitoxin module
MALYLVGENIDKSRSLYQAETGKLVQLMRVARAVRSLSTSPDEDIQLVLRRALFAWLVADGDMHLKNMAMLKISEPGETRFSSVRMAPLTTQLQRVCFRDWKQTGWLSS